MLIGVSGKAGAGKGEFAKIAKEEYGAHIISFASGVKAESADFLDTHGVIWQYRHLYGDQNDKEATLRIAHNNCPEFFKDFIFNQAHYSVGHWYFTPRSLLQWWGTEHRRAQDPDYWVKLALAKITDPDRLYVIDDCRFPNEAQAILDHGGILVKVIRPSAPDISNMAHPSETALDGWTQWHFCIHNNLILNTYKHMCREILTQLTEK